MSQPDSPGALALAAEALAHVLDISPAQLRGDTPLRDVGADSVAVLIFADVAEDFARTRHDLRLTVDDDGLRSAVTLKDLADAFRD